MRDAPKTVMQSGWAYKFPAKVQAHSSASQLIFRRKIVAGGGLAHG